MLSFTLPEISTENMVIHASNMLSGITVMRDGTPKLVKMQATNASAPILSMPS